MSIPPAKDTIESVIEKLNKTDGNKDAEPTTTVVNSTSILGEPQSEEDFLTAYGLIKKKKP
jgi:hypothetical protein